MKTAGEKRAFCGLIKDVIDDSIHGSSVLFRDDTYSWLSDIVYYVERYNFRPEEEFIKYVLSKQNVRFESKEKGEDKPWKNTNYDTDKPESDSVAFGLGFFYPNHKK